MKKNIFYALLMLLTTVTSFTSCDNDSSAGQTRITYYPVLTLNEGATMYVDKGSSFTDPGCKGELNGEDITSKIVTSGSVDASKSGVYTLSYSAVNEDGFSASVSRTVIVTDPNDAHEGVFYTDEDSYRDYSGQKAYGDAYSVIIVSNNDGESYHVYDLLGGWYSQRAGYGDNYNMEGDVTFAEDGTMSLQSSYIAGWGDGLVDFSGKFDAATGTYTWDAEYVSSMKFHVILEK